MRNAFASCLCICLVAATNPSLSGAPELLDSKFRLPEGFHIYKAAGRELTGGSYDLVFDGEGRLLVGDGNKVRRLTDSDGDHVYDKFEIIAEGLGGRGPQGLVVYGDHLYAVGGDGVQLFSGYRAGGTLKHERRLGAPFSTGGDHAAHTVLRGLDGYLYFVTGDGGGANNRVHITEESSPVLFERNASVFRFDPTGEHWECIGAGGRNPPSLGMNYLGEFFSFDSDMEWHVDLPFYRPVRLHHWATGGDQGWQGVGAYPPYYLDCLPGVLEVGRGSPDWGGFYEHGQFPEKYRDAFLVCDYQWKSATSGGYASPGRIVAFHLERDAATWKAEMTLLAQPKEGAVDAQGNRINFGLVDVDVAPDGSIMISDHNQGVWRVFYDPDGSPEIPEINPKAKDAAGATPIDRLLKLPQPMAEWTRLEEERLMKAEDNMFGKLHEVVLDGKRPLRERLRALRLLAPRFEELETSFLAKLAGDAAPELRGQAAWLAGLRKRDDQLVRKLLDDKDPFVRRRAAESTMRIGGTAATSKLVTLLSDEDRFVRYAAMTALAHRPKAELLAEAEGAENPHAVMRLLTAVILRRERPAPEQVQALVRRLFDAGPAKIGTRQDRLDFLRVLGLFRSEVGQSDSLRKRVASHLLAPFPDRDRDLRWEQIRLIGEYDLAAGFGPLLAELEKEEDGVTQFHLADALAKISKGWTPEQSRRLVRWLLSTQSGWFSEYAGKGRQFPGFWNTVLNKLASRHGEALIESADGLKPESDLSKVAFKAIRGAPNADRFLLAAFRAAKNEAERNRLLGVLQGMSSPLIAEALLEDYENATEAGQREMLVMALASQPLPPGKEALFVKALLEVTSKQAVDRCASRILSDGKRFDHYAGALKEAALGEYRGEQAVSFRLLELMSLHPESVVLLERTLQTLSGHQRPSAQIPLHVLWTSDAQNADERVWFAKTFELDGIPREGTLIITCDNEYTAFLNGRKVAQDRNWESPERVEVGKSLIAGTNLLTIVGRNSGGPAGLAALLRARTSDGTTVKVATDVTWKVTGVEPPEGWEGKGATVGSWGPAVDVSGAGGHVLKTMAEFMEKGPAVGPEEIQEHWQHWYRRTYGRPYTSRVVAKTAARSDQQLHALLAGMKEFKGDSARGRQVYLKATCFACHGGLGDKTGTLFGPALAGVTARLNREELADALVYPSRQVSDRFKATELTTVDGETLNGFLTEQSDEFVTITDTQNEVTRLPRARVKEIKSQETSLMPAKLLNGLSEVEIRDLMSFVHELK